MIHCFFHAGHKRLNPTGHFIFAFDVFKVWGPIHGFRTDCTGSHDPGMCKINYRSSHIFVKQKSNSVRHRSELSDGVTIQAFVEKTLDTGPFWSETTFKNTVRFMPSKDTREDWNLKNYIAGDLSRSHWRWLVRSHTAGSEASFGLWRHARVVSTDILNWL